MSKNNLKKQLTLKGNSVKRTVKEYNYYIKDLEKEQEKYNKMEEEKKEEGDLRRQKDIVNECEGAKKQTFASIGKFYNELNQLIAEIEAPADDEEIQKQRTEAKELTEYANALEYLKNAKEILDKDGAAN